MNILNINPLYMLYGFFILVFLILIFIICMNFNIFYESNKITRNINYYAFFDKDTNKIIYNQSNTFYRRLNQIYMSDTIKKEFATTIYNFIKHSKNVKNPNTVNSLRLILSGIEGIGKTTLIEAVASEFDCGIIHFPKNNYSEKMVHTFFNDINNLSNNNIIIFNNINFDSILSYNKHLYELLGELIVKNKNNNIFIFTFTDINTIPFTFTSNYHIHHHYHMETNINNLMNMIKDNIDELSENKLDEIKNKFLQINHKITPGYIIPYLIFNEDFQKSLEQFFRIIKN